MPSTSTLRMRWERGPSGIEHFTFLCPLYFADRLLLSLFCFDLFVYDGMRWTFASKTRLFTANMISTTERFFIDGPTRIRCGHRRRFPCWEKEPFCIRSFREKKKHPPRSLFAYRPKQTICLPSHACMEAWCVVDTMHMSVGRWTT